MTLKQSVEIYKLTLPRGEVVLVRLVASQPAIRAEQQEAMQYAASN